MDPNKAGIKIIDKTYQYQLEKHVILQIFDWFTFEILHGEAVVGFINYLSRIRTKYYVQRHKTNNKGANLSLIQKAKKKIFKT